MYRHDRFGPTAAVRVAIGYSVQFEQKAVWGLCGPLPTFLIEGVGRVTGSESSLCYPPDALKQTGKHTNDHGPVKSKQEAVAISLLPTQLPRRSWDSF